MKSVAAVGGHVWESMNRRHNAPFFSAHGTEDMTRHFTMASVIEQSHLSLQGVERQRGQYVQVTVVSLELV